MQAGQIAWASKQGVFCAACLMTLAVAQEVWSSTGREKAQYLGVESSLEVESCHNQGGYVLGLAIS